MVTVPTTVEWRLLIEVSGNSVVETGICPMLEWCVESWAVDNLYMLWVMIILDKDQDQSS